VGYGGQTRATAGTLTLGSDNTFTVAEATVDDLLYNQAWWEFDAATTSRVTLSAAGIWIAVYANDDTVQVEYADYEVYASASFDALTGVTYRVLVGTLEPEDAPATYVVTYAQRALATTAWLSTFRDSDENVLVVSPGTSDPPGDLQALNNSEFAATKSWYNELVDWEGPSGRRSQYDILEVVGGADPVTAASCAWSHAEHGDSDIVLWNTSTTDPDDSGPPTCLPLISGPADPALNNSILSDLHIIGDGVPGGLGSVMRARRNLTARGLHFLQARDNLSERGVLPFTIADPVSDGVPAEFADDAVFQWEPGQDLELLKVEIAGDTVGRPAEGAGETGVTIFVNDLILQGYDHWAKGVEGVPEGSRPHVFFDYVDGDPAWHELTNITSWDDCSEDEPDAMAGLCIAGAPLVGEVFTSESDVAVRLTFRSPRYRWVYDGPTTVVRQWPRDDVRGVSAAPRLWPPSKTRRIAGGYPGGSNA
jgi:hypothetical protein